MTIEEIIEAKIHQLVDEKIKQIKESQPPPLVYMTVSEASEFIRCSNSKIRELYARGKIDGYRQGKKIIFKRGDIIDYLEKGKNII